MAKKIAKKGTKKPAPKKASCMPAADAPPRYQLVHLFWQLAPAFTRWAESHMHMKGLTPQRIRLMQPLMQNGPMKMSELRDELGVTATSITALVDALEKDGMVKRQPHKTDRRATMIKLTPKAEKSLNDNCSQFTENVSGIFTGLSVPEQKQLRTLLERMRKTLVEKEILND